MVWVPCLWDEWQGVILLQTATPEYGELSEVSSLTGQGTLLGGPTIPHLIH